MPSAIWHIADLGLYIHMAHMVHTYGTYGRYIWHIWLYAKPCKTSIHIMELRDDLRNETHNKV